MKVGEELLKEARLEEGKVPRGSRVWMQVDKDGKCSFTFATDHLAEELEVTRVDGLAVKVAMSAQAIGQAIADAWTKEKMPAVNYASSGKRAVVSPVSHKSVVIRGERGRVIMQVEGSVSPPGGTKDTPLSLLGMASAAVKKAGAIVKSARAR